MTVAISACGNGWQEQLDERFGRARGFFLVDSETGKTQFLDNQSNIDAAHGAGTGAVRTLLENNVGVVITGRVGPKASAALEAAGVRVVTAESGSTLERVWKQYQQSIDQSKQ